MLHALQEAIAFYNRLQHRRLDAITEGSVKWHVLLATLKTVVCLRE